MDISDRFRIEKLRHYVSLIGRRITRGSVGPRELYVLEPAGPWHEAPPDDAAWAPFSVGDAWGGKQGWTAFRAALCVPEEWAGHPVELRMRHFVRWLEPPVDDNFPAGPEGQVFIDGLRAGAIDGAHHSIRAAFEPGHCYDVRAVFFAGRAACRHELEVLELACVDAGAERLYHDLRVALDLVEVTPEGAPARRKLLEAVEAAVRIVEQGDLGTAGATSPAHFGPAGSPATATEEGGFYHHVHDAHMAFSDGLAEITGDGDAPEVVCFGHAHIDLGWLWPFEQSRHKCARTFATQCRLLEQYDGWSFLQSQAQAYAWVEQAAPDLFERIRALAKAGRWEVEGATWAEMDTNVTGGESLVRQFLYGKRYFREKFGVDCKVLWLPDVFGYSAALPQLMKLAGVEGFVTSKMSWNTLNRFPYDTFRWRGLDGTDLPTLFITTPGGEWYYTYNAGMTARQLKGTWDEYRQKDVGTEPVMSFGHGDGGGGPTETMLETAERLARGPALPGVPRVRLGTIGALMGRIARARRAAARLGRRTLPGVPPRHLHQPGAG